MNFDLLSLLTNRMKAATPTNLDVYSKVMTSDEDTEITAQDFTSDELYIIGALATIAEQQGRTNIIYEDYDLLRGYYTLPQLNLTSTDPVHIVESTLGRFNATPSDEGGFDISDTYDFNPNFATREESAMAYKNTARSLVGLGVDGVYEDADGNMRFAPVPFTVGDSFAEKFYMMLRMGGEAFGPRDGEGDGVPVRFSVERPHIGSYIGK